MKAYNKIQIPREIKEEKYKITFRRFTNLHGFPHSFMYNDINRY